MGAATYIARFIGEKAMSLLKVPTTEVNGIKIMNPYVYSYEEKVKDLAHETSKVNLDFVRSIIEEAYRKNDMKALKVCYDYMITVYKMSPHTGFMWHIIKYGQDIILRNHVGNPFAMIESVVNNLC